MKILNKRSKLDAQFKEYLDYCENVRRLSPYTLRAKRWVLMNFKKCVPVNCLEELTNKHIDDWIALQTKGCPEINMKPCCPATVNHRLAHTIAMLKYFRDMNLEMPNLKLAMIIKQKTRATEKREFYYREEIIRVLSIADRREWLFIALSFDCGLRISELANIRVSSLEGRKIRVIGKGGKLRYCMMAKETYTRLLDYIEREQPEDYLWTGWSPAGDIVPLSTGQIERKLKEVFTKAGFPEFHHHMLRHSFAMDLLLVQKATLREIQTLMGHSRMQTTEEYLSRMSAEEASKTWLDSRYRVSYDTELR